MLPFSGEWVFSFVDKHEDDGHHVIMHVNKGSVNAVTALESPWSSLAWIYS